MKEVERRGVLIDVCPECRGVWLDRGELDKLLATAEGYEAVRQSESRERRETPGEDDYPKGKWEKRKKHRGLLGEIFDFDLFD